LSSFQGLGFVFSRFSQAGFMFLLEPPVAMSPRRTLPLFVIAPRRARLPLLYSLDTMPL
jgi:hypothetical protein